MTLDRREALIKSVADKEQEVTEALRKLNLVQDELAELKSRLQTTKLSDGVYRACFTHNGIPTSGGIRLVVIQNGKAFVYQENGTPVMKNKDVVLDPKTIKIGGSSYFDFKLIHSTEPHPIKKPKADSLGLYKAYYVDSFGYKDLRLIMYLGKCASTVLNPSSAESHKTILTMITHHADDGTSTNVSLSGIPTTYTEPHLLATLSDLDLVSVDEN